MSELLLEIRSEEIPARMQDRAREDLASLVTGMLKEAGIAHDPAIQTFATPMRLVLVATGLPERQPDRATERRGPREDAPVAAIEGFRKSLAGLDATVETREEKKGRVLFALVKESGRPTQDLLAEKLPDLLARFPWPKSMRWGSGDARWVRPLRSILCLLGGQMVPFEFAGVSSGNTTAGHRFMAPKPVTVTDFADYRAKLLAAKVMLDGAERKELVRAKASMLAAEHGLSLPEDEALLDEVKGLVEWPVPLLATIDEQFMDVPGEVLVSTMRANQKYLTLRDGQGRLARQFVVVANNEADDGGATIVAGNERVLRARLWDARFFWEQDRKVSLESRLPKLGNMVFHEKLGSQGQRVERLVALAGALVPHVPGAQRATAERAALLAKADLVSGMVGEFPELQGIMGSHYARIQGEDASVAQAIAEQYSPKGPDDGCPTAPTSIVLALADRLDTLVGFFAAGIRPTGSKDPFALRRAALGIVRLIVENGLRLDLRRALLAADAGHGGKGDVGEVLAFLVERLRVHLRGEGVRHDIVAAALAVASSGDLVLTRARVAALRELLDGPDGANLVAGYRRASSILAIEEKKDGCRYDGEPDPSLAREPEERQLLRQLDGAQAEIAGQLAQARFGEAMTSVASLRGPIDAFFDKVLVNAPEPGLRANRLLMLNRVRSALGGIADFGLIEESGRSAA